MLSYMKKQGKLDYVELYARRDAKFDDIDKWYRSELILSVHAPHDNRGGYIPHYLAYGQSIARYLKVDRVILDAGCVFDADIFKHKGKNIYIENMPYVSNKGDLFRGVFPSEFKDSNLCLDLAHAWIAATHLGEEHKSYVAEFLNLRPKHIHFTDSQLEWSDDHAPLDIGVLDLKWALKRIDKDAWLTIETDHEVLQREEAMRIDIETLNKLLGK